jgi:NADH:ubiquinone oxidoreductase subunit 5 (subunit L)/multisubunit Na+/H+ antiporter MnhA subunit
MEYALLLVFLLPALGVPFVYLTGKKSPRAAAILVALIALANMALLFTTVPTVLDSPNHEYVEPYYWIPILE